MSKSGKIVKTKRGFVGKVYNDMPIVAGKVAVYLEDNTKLLCDHNTVEIIGFFD